jgi:predicted ATP-grasp superfamily ATP-dependent carboligase
MGSGDQVSIPVEALTSAIEIANKLLDLLPLNTATSLLTEEARKRANMKADIAEAMKFDMSTVRKR